MFIVSQCISMYSDVSVCNTISPLEIILKYFVAPSIRRNKIRNKYCEKGRKTQQMKEVSRLCKCQKMKEKEVVCKSGYFPIQKFLKIFPNTSSVLISPVISPKKCRHSLMS